MKRKIVSILLLIALLTVSFTNFVVVGAVDNTFTGETIDGGIDFFDVGVYPPEDDGASEVWTDKTTEQVGQTLLVGVYFAIRSYVSFDTSSLPNDANISSLILSLKTESDSSTTDFNVTIYGDTQPIWGNSLTVADWDTGTVPFDDTWDTSGYVDETYVNFTIPTDQCNTNGKTQFMIASDREYADTTPTDDEYVNFHMGDSGGNEPKLYVTYSLAEPEESGMQSTTTLGNNWLFANEWNEFKMKYTYVGDVDTVLMAFSDLYEANQVTFDGNDTDDPMVRVGSDSSLNATSLTVSFWVYPIDGTTHEYLVSRYGRDGWAVRKNNNDKIAVWLRNSTGDNLEYFSDTTLDINAWNYVCFQYDDDKEEVYIWIGTTKTTKYNVPHGFENEPVQVQIGGEGWMDNNYFNGTIDEVRIYDTVLTETEVNYDRTHYEPENHLTTNVKLLFHFDEGEGTTITDSSTNGNDGVFYSISGEGCDWETGGIIGIDPHWAVAKYDITLDEWDVISGSEIIVIKAGTYEKNDDDNYITWNLFFQDAILDRINVTIYTWAANIEGTVYPWDVFAEDWFNIYNLGGYKTLITSGDSGQTTGGDWMELYSDADGWSMSNVTFRKLQHFRAVLSINLGADPDSNVNLNERGYFALGVDYLTSNWVNGWYVNITNYDSDIGGTWAGSTWTSWICLNCSWYNRGTFVKSDNVTVFWEGKDDGINQFRVQVDFWFNRINSSTTIGGRVAPLYFGVMGSGQWFGSTKVKPAYADTGHLGTVTNMTQSSYFFEDLMDENNNITSCRELDLMRPWFKLGRIDNNAGVIYEVLEAKETDFIMAEGKMVGINTPQFEEPKMYDFPQRGLLSWLSASFQGWVSQLQHSLGGQTLLSLWSVFVNFMDSIAMELGMPNGFTILMSYITQFFTWMVTSFGYLVTILGDGFSFLGAVMSKFITLFSNVINGGISIFTAFSDIIDGVYTQGLDLWNDYFVSFLPLFPVAMLIYLMWRFDAGGFEAITNDLTFALNVGSFLVHGFISIIQLFLSLIGRVIESIPVVE